MEVTEERFAVFDSAHKQSLELTSAGHRHKMASLFRRTMESVKAVNRNNSIAFIIAAVAVVAAQRAWRVSGSVT